MKNNLAFESISTEIISRIDELPTESDFVKYIYPKIKNFKIEISDYTLTKVGLALVYKSDDIFISIGFETFSISRLKNKSTNGFIYRFHTSRIGHLNFFSSHFSNYYYMSEGGIELKRSDLQSLSATYSHFPYLNEEELIHWRLKR